VGRSSAKYYAQITQIVLPDSLVEFGDCVKSRIPPTQSVDYSYAAYKAKRRTFGAPRVRRCCEVFFRPDMKNQPTAVGGILLFYTGLVVFLDLFGVIFGSCVRGLIVENTDHFAGDQSHERNAVNPGCSPLRCLKGGG
jgi:hypothetical protein